MRADGDDRKGTHGRAPAAVTRPAQQADRQTWSDSGRCSATTMPELQELLPKPDGTFRHPGSWEVAMQETDLPAVHFWRRVATEVAGQEWTEARRRVPDRPDLPPDFWIRVDTRL